MKQTTIILVMLGTLFTGSLNARADSGNPFGFETNKHPLEYEYCKKAKPRTFASHYWYECNSAPKVHPDIEAYYLNFVEQVGLCNIVIESFDPNAGTDKLGKMFKMFKGQLVKKYGPPTRKPEEEAKIPYDWDQETGFKEVGAVKAIRLTKHSRHTGSHYRHTVQIFFTLATSDTCQKKMEENRNSAF